MFRSRSLPPSPCPSLGPEYEEEEKGKEEEEEENGERGTVCDLQSRVAYWLETPIMRTVDLPSSRCRRKGNVAMYV